MQHLSFLSPQSSIQNPQKDISACPCCPYAPQIPHWKGLSGYMDTLTVLAAGAGRNGYLAKPGYLYPLYMACRGLSHRLSSLIRSR